MFEEHFDVPKKRNEKRQRNRNGGPNGKRPWGTGEIDGQGGEVARGGKIPPKAPCSTARSAKRMA
jgi:hypothetical protein